MSPRNSKIKSIELPCSAILDIETIPREACVDRHTVEDGIAFLVHAGYLRVVKVNDEVSEYIPIIKNPSQGELDAIAARAKASPKAITPKTDNVTI